jgi:lysophospholipase L1-like esterase
VIKTTNRFEALYNLDKEQTKQINMIKTNSHKSNVTTQRQRIKKSTSSRINKEEVSPVFNIPVLVNGCVFYNTPLKASTTVMSAANSSDSEIEKRTNANLVQFPLNKNIKHTNVLIGDSHIRNCADMTKDNLNKMYNVIGFVKPGADINILSSVESVVSSLTHNDVIVFSGGTKDIGKNNSKEGLRNILNFVKTNTHTNIVLLTVPHRYNLESWSCVNDEIRAYNRKLEKCTKCFKHVTLLNHDPNKALYTKHGLHFNKTGKNVLARNIVQTWQKIFYEDIKPIYLSWKENNNNFGSETQKLSGMNDFSCENNLREGSKLQTFEPLCKSSRLKKLLLNRHNDFLW